MVGLHTKRTCRPTYHIVIYFFRRKYMPATSKSEKQPHHDYVNTTFNHQEEPSSAAPTSDYYNDVVNVPVGNSAIGATSTTEYEDVSALGAEEGRANNGYGNKNVGPGNDVMGHGTASEEGGTAGDYEGMVGQREVPRTAADYEAFSG